MTVDSSDSFASRHIGPRASDLPEMLATVRAASLDALVDEAVPSSIRLTGPLPLPAAESAKLKDMLKPVYEQWAQGLDNRGLPGNDVLKAFLAALPPAP